MSGSTNYVVVFKGGEFNNKRIFMPKAKQAKACFDFREYHHVSQNGIKFLDGKTMIERKVVVLDLTVEPTHTIYECTAEDRTITEDCQIFTYKLKPCDS